MGRKRKSELALRQTPSCLLTDEQKKNISDEIDRVKNELENCIRSHMTKDEAIVAVGKDKNILGTTTLVWQQMEKENPEFFKAYYLRLKLIEQIKRFNTLLEQQLQNVIKYQGHHIHVPQSNMYNGLGKVPVNPSMIYPVQQLPHDSFQHQHQQQSHDFFQQQQTYAPTQMEPAHNESSYPLVDASPAAANYNPTQQNMNSNGGIMQQMAGSYHATESTSQYSLPPTASFYTEPNGQFDCLPTARYSTEPNFQFEGLPDRSHSSAEPFQQFLPSPQGYYPSAAINDLESYLLNDDIQMGVQPETNNSALPPNMHYMDEDIKFEPEILGGNSGGNLNSDYVQIDITNQGGNAGSYNGSMNGGTTFEGFAGFSNNYQNPPLQQPGILFSSTVK